MGAKGRGKNAPLIEQLATEPYRFEFFQAVRILEAWTRAPDSEKRRRLPVGLDHAPSDEAVRFRTYVSHRFPAAEIHSCSMPHKSDAIPELVVAFLGSVGPGGILPQHYTQLMIDRVRQKDYSLRDFLDMFHHRLVSLYHRAWEKYRFPLEYEAVTANGHAGDDRFTNALYSFMGMATDGTRDRQEIPHEAFLYYAGLFSHANRTTVSLERLIEDYFGLPTEIQQFQGQWLYLDRDDQSQMSSGFLGGANNRLGTNVVVGNRVWGIENRFRVRVGPVGYQEFTRLMPNGDLLKPITQLVRSYVGPEFDFDIQPILRASEVPMCQLGSPGKRRRDTPPPQLGWNTWAMGRAAATDATDAVFVDPNDIRP